MLGFSLRHLFIRLGLIAPLETLNRERAEVAMAPTAYSSPRIQKSTIAFWLPIFSQESRRIEPLPLRQTPRHGGFSR